MSSSLSILPVRVRKGRRSAVADTGNDGRDTGRGVSESRDAFSTHLVPKNRKTPRAVARGAQGSARSEEHTSELQSLMRISYAVFCLNKQIILHCINLLPPITYI